VKILAIRFARLGDVLLLLPALTSLKQKFPDSQLVFLTGVPCAPVAEMCPAIDEVIAVDRIAMRDGPVVKAVDEMTRLVRTLRRRQFDLVVDFHSFRETNLLTWLSGASVRIGMKKHRAAYWGFCFNRPPVLEDKSIHVSEMFQRVVAAIPSPAAPPPCQPLLGGRGLVIPNVLRDESKLVLYIDAPVQDRIWPPERFAEVADFAIEQLGATVVVISSNTGAELATRLRSATKHSDRLRLLTNVGLADLVATIASARLLVSNDTGPMHIGPVVRVPTLGLFSVGYPEHFRPLGPKDRYLRGNPIEKIEVRDVVANVEEMWTTAADPDLRR
jgi:ADP-heptose:LPS heptosyltransferase